MNLFQTDNKPIDQSLNLAMNYLSYQPRTVYGMQEYLRKKGVKDDIIKKTIDILLEKKYLDDADFARLFIESRINTNAKSKFALAYELKKKGISTVIIHDLLNGYNDEDLALKAVRLKIKRWKHLDQEKFKKKVMNYLRYRGFNYDICISMLNRFAQPED